MCSVWKEPQLLCWCSHLHPKNRDGSAHQLCCIQNKGQVCVGGGDVWTHARAHPCMLACTHIHMRGGGEYLIGLVLYSNLHGVSLEARCAGHPSSSAPLKCLHYNQHAWKYHGNVTMVLASLSALRSVPDLWHQGGRKGSSKQSDPWQRP